MKKIIGFVISVNVFFCFSYILSEPITAGLGITTVIQVGNILRNYGT